MNRYLVVGLGNYPPVFSGTRHNAGQSALLVLCQKLGISWQPGLKQSKIAMLTQDQHQFYFLQPHCYMNDSGSNILAHMHFYQIPLTNLVVLYDDLDVELGKVKLKDHGSAGGHNGVRSIINCLQTNHFVRVRIGIKPILPTNVGRKELVLLPFTAPEYQQLKNSYNHVYEVMSNWIYRHYPWCKILSLYQQKNTG